MGEGPVLIIERVGAVARWTLNRPAKMNAINGAMLGALEAALADIEADDAVRVLLLAGAGPAFCAGADLKEALAGLNEPKPFPDFLERSAAVFSALRELKKPVIAAVNGLALAGGLELVLCADIVLAAESARFGDAHANYGVFPGAGGAALLPRALPPAVARYLLFSGDTLPAADMHRHGLVTAVHPDGALAEAAMALAERIALKSPLVLSRMKEVAAGALDQSRADALRHEQLMLRAHLRSADLREGLAAFAEGRPPQFTGR